LPVCNLFPPIPLGLDLDDSSLKRRVRRLINAEEVESLEVER
jgi:hypothetical protein